MGGDAAGNVLIGDAGNDLLFGRAGDDQLFGGDGYDYIEGGLGFDYARYDSAAAGYRFQGGAAKDSFVLTASDLASASRDEILDFNTTGDPDVLVFSDVAREDLILTNVSGGTLVLVDIPGPWGDVFVAGVAADTLSGYLISL